MANIDNMLELISALSNSTIADPVYSHLFSQNMGPDPLQKMHVYRTFVLKPILRSSSLCSATGVCWTLFIRPLTLRSQNAAEINATGWTLNRRVFALELNKAVRSGSFSQ